MPRGSPQQARLRITQHPVRVESVIRPYPLYSHCDHIATGTHSRNGCARQDIPAKVQILPFLPPSCVMGLPSQIGFGETVALVCDPQPVGLSAGIGEAVAHV